MDSAFNAELQTILKNSDSEIKAEIEKAKREQEVVAKKRGIYLEKLKTTFQKQNINFESLVGQTETEDQEISSEIELDDRHKNNSYLNVQSFPSIPAWIVLPDYWTKLYDGVNVIQEGQNLGDIRIGDYVYGTGCGWASSGEATLRFRIFRVFWFQPTRADLHNFTLFMPYYGYYKVVSNDGSWDFKEAWARINGKVTIEQYGTTNINHEYSHLNITGENIDTRGTVNTVGVESVTAILQPNSPAWIKVYQDFSLRAIGDGSAAQLDFQSPDWNFRVSPVRVYVR